MLIEELELLIKSTKKSSLGGLSIKINNNKELNDLLLKRTGFLEKEVNNAERFYYIIHDLHEIKKCLFCYKELKISKNTFCSHKCNILWQLENTSLKDKIIKSNKNKSQETKNRASAKRIKTLIEKYGVDHNFKIPGVKEKRRNTWIENLGVDNPIKNKNVKLKIFNTNKEKYGNICPLNGKDQIKKKIKTWEKNLGVDNPSKNINIKVKKEETCLINHGVKYPAHNKEIVKKQRNTWIKNKIEGKHNIFKYKIYEFKSGRKIIYQGDEGKALNQWIISRYKEEDIINDISFMYNLKIIYIDNNSIIKERLYIPDFYIKNKNLIIEVKSLYFYKKLLDNIFLKSRATVNMGFNFILLINTGKKFITKSYEEIKADFKKIH